MTNKQRLNEIIWVGKIQLTAVAKVMGISKGRVSQILQNEVSDKQFKKIMDAVEFIIESQNTVYNRIK